MWKGALLLIAISGVWDCSLSPKLPGENVEVALGQAVKQPFVVSSTLGRSPEIASRVGHLRAGS